MARPSPKAIDAIRSRVADWTPDDRTIADSLNEPTVPNPTLQPTVPKPYRTRDLMEALDTAAIAKIKALPSLGRLLDDIAKGEPDQLENWISLLQSDGTIDQDQAGALYAIVHGTEPDPDWPANVSWAEVTIGRAVDESDIAASRPEV